MTDLKLAKLPDRIPLNLTVLLSQDLVTDLDAYAALYRERYGADEPLNELIPAMLRAFMDVTSSSVVLGRSELDSNEG